LIEVLKGIRIPVLEAGKKWEKIQNILTIFFGRKIKRLIFVVPKQKRVP